MRQGGIIIGCALPARGTPVPKLPNGSNKISGGKWSHLESYVPRQHDGTRRTDQAEGGLCTRSNRSHATHATVLHTTCRQLMSERQTQGRTEQTADCLAGVTDMNTSRRVRLPGGRGSHPWASRRGSCHPPRTGCTPARYRTTARGPSPVGVHASEGMRSVGPPITSHPREAITMHLQ